VPWQGGPGGCKLVVIPSLAVYVPGACSRYGFWKGELTAYLIAELLETERRRSAGIDH
jgi:hypothetical protein